MTDWMDLTGEDFSELEGFSLLDPLPLERCSECGEYAQQVSPGHWECGCFRRFRERAA